MKSSRHCAGSGSGKAALAVSGDPPPLPNTDGQVVIPAQSATDGEARAINIHLHYPGGRLKNVKASTGLMLCLHNWGGIGFCEGGESCSPDAYDAVMVGVDYYQSGDTPDSPLPYDFGYLQAADALRALWFVYHGLTAGQVPFDRRRIYGMGGSGGGNVVQMANKFAPRTFACIVDCSGMASLTDEIAFHLPGGSSLNARYSRDPQNPAYLSKAMQEIRDLGNPDHLDRMAQYGNRCLVVVIHGEDDAACLAADKRRMVDAMRRKGLEVAPHFIAAGDVDGVLIMDSGHGIGDRRKLMLHYAGDFLRPGSAAMRRLAGPCDFERREPVVYPVTGGAHTMSFAEGWPVLTFTEEGWNGRR